MASSTKIRIPRINTVNDSGRSNNALMTTSTTTSIDKNLKELINITNTIKNNQIQEAKNSSSQLIKIDKNLDRNIAEFKKAYGNFVTTTEHNSTTIETDSDDGTSARISSRTETRSKSYGGSSRSHSNNVNDDKWMPYDGIASRSKRAMDKAASGFLPATAVSVATGGAINPVMLQALWGPLKEIVGLAKDVALLPFKAIGGIYNTGKNIGHGIGKLFGGFGGGGDDSGYGLQGETKATANAKNDKLYKKLDTIIDLIGKSNKVTVEEEGKPEFSWKDVIAKILMTVGLLSAAALAFLPELKEKATQWISDFLSGKLGISEGNAQLLGKAITDAIPGMVVGYMVGGLPGALLGGTAVAIYKNWDVLKQKWDEMMGNDGPDKPEGINISLEQFTGLAIGGGLGLKIGGIRGALLGGAVGYIAGTIVKFKNKLEKEAGSDKEVTWADAAVEAFNSATMTEKVVLAATMGFSVGGVKGALIGAGVVFGIEGIKLLKQRWDALHDEEGNLDLSKLTAIEVGALTAATAIPAAILGFKYGGVKGALIGVGVVTVAGLAVDMATKFKKLINGQLDDEDRSALTKEIMLSTTITGACIGLKAGGFQGALIGALIGATVGAGVSLVLNWDKVQSAFNTFTDTIGRAFGGLKMAYDRGGLSGVMSYIFSDADTEYRELADKEQSEIKKYLEEDLAFDMGSSGDAYIDGFGLVHYDAETGQITNIDDRGYSQERINQLWQAQKTRKANAGHNILDAKAVERIEGKFVTDKDKIAELEAKGGNKVTDEHWFWSNDHYAKIKGNWIELDKYAQAALTDKDAMERMKNMVHGILAYQKNHPGAKLDAKNQSFTLNGHTFNAQEMKDLVYLYEYASLEKSKGNIQIGAPDVNQENEKGEEKKEDEKGTAAKDTTQDAVLAAATQDIDLEKVNEAVEVKNEEMSLDNSLNREQREIKKANLEKSTEVYDALLELLGDINFKQYFEENLKLNRERNELIKEQEPSTNVISVNGSNKHKNINTQRGLVK
ncbi:MAG: hypothetical protein IKO49_02025 [Bacilli bacterium]|nr:hypothetical protein [Clostridia bacterium]MBR4618058.1 hypothetical protein [Bacilli bacterium]